MGRVAVCGLLIAAAGCGGSRDDEGASPVRGGVIIAKDLPPEQPVDVAVPWELYRDGVQNEIDRAYVEKSCTGIDEAVSRAVEGGAAFEAGNHDALRAYATTLKRRLRCA